MPIITLSSDIGLGDYIIGAVKGQIVSALPTANIVDVVHYMSAKNYYHSGYICSNALKYFPAKTINLVIFNLFFKNPEHFLVAEINGQIFICPDNGILTMIINKVPERVVKVALPQGKTITTLEFTQAMVNAAVAISEGLSLEKIGILVEDIVTKYPLQPTFGTDWIEGQIIFVDNFENVIVNITKKEFEEISNGRDFELVFNRNETIKTIGENYASVPVSEKLAWFNSAGFLEISINNGNVAGLFGLKPFADIKSENTYNNQPSSDWMYRTIRIFFKEIAPDINIPKAPPRLQQKSIL
ncbi:SAM hydrolase/SAM-dependent halogenase family protein [Rhizosphaericola mali]|uniref:SAM-dependent chlorinase/fluorinase n=1 Tax=Rhizosphaericola mali TaxID=2545455 RepID=A0A5P2G7Q4_9BACT|nr:SAM-dependent chlorinase/fluorinase [Rhizosphaericola mali]QES89233.1 SAM-dependent chlorinase/fluorinase [Rhizosphaericola mali]